MAWIPGSEWWSQEKLIAGFLVNYTETAELLHLGGDSSRGQEEMTLFWECPNQGHLELLCQMQPLGLRTAPAAVFRLFRFCHLKEMLGWMDRGRVKESSPVIHSCCIFQDITDGFCALLLPFLHPALQVESQLLLRVPCGAERSCLGYFEGS